MIPNQACAGLQQIIPSCKTKVKVTAVKSNCFYPLLVYPDSVITQIRAQALVGDENQSLSPGEGLDQRRGRISVIPNHQDIAG